MKEATISEATPPTPNQCGVCGERAGQPATQFVMKDPCDELCCMDFDNCRKQCVVLVDELRIRGSSAENELKNLRAASERQFEELDRANTGLATESERLRAALETAELQVRHRDRQLAAMMTWLEANQPDAFRRNGPYPHSDGEWVHWEDYQSERLRVALERFAQYPQGLTVQAVREIERLAAFEHEHDSLLRGRVPTHRCKVCGALWIFWPAGTAGMAEASWSLFSLRCGKCCDCAPMSKQIERLPRLGALSDEPSPAHETCDDPHVSPHSEKLKCELQRGHAGDHKNGRWSWRLKSSVKA